MAAERKRQILCRHAAAIIGDTDQRLATIGIVHRDTPRARVQRVFHQFLHGRGRTFHNLTRRDAVDRGLVQLSDHRTRAVGPRYLGGIKHHAPTASMGAQIRPQA